MLVEEYGRLSLQRLVLWSSPRRRDVKSDLSDLASKPGGGTIAKQHSVPLVPVMIGSTAPPHHFHHCCHNIAAGLGCFPVISLGRAKVW